MKQILILGIVLTLLAASTTAWLDEFEYRKQINITNDFKNNLTNYTLILYTHYGSGTDTDNEIYLNSKTKDNFTDVRFTNHNDDYLNYWTENFTDGNNATFNIDFLNLTTTENKSFYVYYGSGNDTTLSNISSGMFLFADEFNNTPVQTPLDDKPEWTVTSSGGGKRIYEQYGHAFCTYGYTQAYTTDVTSLVNYTTRAKIRTNDNLNAYGIITARGDTSGVYGNDGITLWTRSNANYLNIRKAVAGTYTTLDDTVNPHNHGDEWVITELTLEGTQVNATFQNATMNSSDTAIASNGRVKWGTRGNQNGPRFDVDWITARPYVNPEPYISAIGTEETSITDTCTYSGSGDWSIRHNCTVSTTVNLLGNSVSVNGNVILDFTATGSIFNYSIYAIHGTALDNCKNLNGCVV